MAHRMRARAYRDYVPGALLAAACTMASAQPNPYAEVHGWLEPPEGRPIGGASSVYAAAEIFGAEVGATTVRQHIRH